MEENSSTANQVPETPVAQPEASKSTNPNELEFDMTPEQEADYVNQILSGGSYTPPEDDKPATPDPKLPEPAKTPEAPASPETPPAPEKTTEEVAPEKSTELTTPQSDDLWVEVEQVVTDELGEETTKTVKLVYDPADPASFIPDDFNAKSTKQLAEIMDAKAEMAELFKERQAEYDKALAGKNAAQQEKDILAGWDAEIRDLIDSKVLEAPKLKPGEEGYNADPSVQKTDAVFKFMTEKNEERAKNGIPPIGSFGLAFTMFENDTARKEAEAAEKKANEDTKIKGAMIGGGSAASGGTAEQTAYKSGSHKSIWSVPVED